MNLIYVALLLVLTCGAFLACLLAWACCSMSRMEEVYVPVTDDDVPNNGPRTRGGY